jgi:hypothetical protein
VNSIRAIFLAEVKVPNNRMAAPREIIGWVLLIASLALGFGMTVFAPV